MREIAFHKEGLERENLKPHGIPPYSSRFVGKV